MVDLTHLKLAGDVLLALSIVFLTFRLARSRGGQIASFETRQLESTLRGLIAEAGEASKSFNDQLAKRQRELERILFDASTAESRITRSLSNAEEQQGNLETQAGRVSRQIEELRIETKALLDAKSQLQNAAPRARAEIRHSAAVREQEFRSEETPSEFYSEATAATAPLAERVEVQHDTRTPIAAAPPVRQEASRHRARFIESAGAQPPRSELLQRSVEAEVVVEASQDYSGSITASSRQPAAATFSVRAEGEKRAVSAPRVNIYGDLLDEAAEPDYQPLTKQVERIKQPAAPALQSAAEGAYQKAEARAQLQRIYAAAEQLIRSGADLSTVAQKTALPIEELRAMAQVVEREREASKQHAEIDLESQVQSVDLTNLPKRQTVLTREQGDPRLGVLSGIKRQTQVL